MVKCGMDGGLMLKIYQIPMKNLMILGEELWVMVKMVEKVKKSVREVWREFSQVWILVVINEALPF